jgi:hypothetical protein
MVLKISLPPFLVMWFLNCDTIVLKLWVEQFLLIELQQKWKEANGKYSGKVWTRKIERCLIKCSLIRNFTIQRVAMLADRN